MLKNRLVGVFSGLALVGLFVGLGAGPDADQLKKDLVGTWEYASPDRPAEIKHVKYITPTHFVWVTYSTKAMAPYASAGGTWTIEDGRYKERVEFATEGHKHLRGKETSFSIALDGDTWTHKGTLDTGFEVDEVWTRVKK